MFPRGKYNAWMAQMFFKAKLSRVEHRLGSITSENIYRKTLQLPETARNKEGVLFQEERKLEFGWQEVKECIIY